MNNLSNIFSTREIAIFIWFLILLIFAIRTKEVRNSIVRVIKAFFNRKLFLAFCTLLIYILLVVFILSVIGFWDISLLKDTVFWTLFSGIVLFMNINKIENVNYFSSLIKDNIKVIVIWEFLFNFYTLSLIGELVLIPVVSLFSIMEVFAEHSSKQEENQKKVVTFCKNVLGLIGLGLIVYVVYKTITKYELLFSVSCVGCLIGAANEFRFSTHNVSMYVLYALMLQVGIGIGCNRQLKELIKSLRFKMLLVPVATITGTLLFSAFASLLLTQWSVFDCMAVGSGFAYYSLSSILITQFQEPSMGLQLATELGTIALLANIFREMMALLGAPLIRKYFGRLAPISAAGVNSMDVLLPSITRYSGKDMIPIAIFHGILIDMSVPVFVSFFCNL